MKKINKKCKNTTKMMILNYIMLNLNNYNKGKVIDMRKKQKLSNSIVKIEEQSSNEDNEISKFRQKKRQKEQSVDSVQRKSQNTLSLLTKNFITLIKSKQNMTIDSNDAARQLGIQKRRIYDITNVLQGIGYVQKVHKNKLRWVGGAKDPKVSSQIDSFDSQINFLQRRQLQLTSKIQYLQKRIKNDFIQNKQLNFLRLSYLKEIMHNLPSRPKRIIVVKAPKDTAIITQQRQNSDQVDIEIYFSKQSKGSVFYVTRNQFMDEMQQEKILKLEETEKKIKREQS